MKLVSGIFFFKQKTAYEMRISDWSSDVCSSDLQAAGQQGCHPQCRCEAGHANTGSVGLSDHDVKLEADHQDHRNEGCQQVEDAAIGEIEDYSTKNLSDEEHDVRHGKIPCYAG